MIRKSQDAIYAEFSLSLYRYREAVHRVRFATQMVDYYQDWPREQHHNAILDLNTARKNLELQAALVSELHAEAEKIWHECAKSANQNKKRSHK